MTSTIISASTISDIQDYIISSYPPKKNQMITISPEGRSIKIKQIKDLRIVIASIPQLPRIVWISQAETMTIPSQNALLKLLEEPPTNTTFVLSTINHNTLLETIQSRCILIRINKTKDPKYSIDSTTLTLIKDAMGQPDGERILLTQKIGKTRDDALIWLDKAISALSESVHTTKNSKSLILLQKIINTTLKSRDQLNANTNVTLTLENYLLSLPRIK